ncbi:hypothetical protein L6164_026511 [Bauhinia variegata]|uniref:Uncharacterized protein n=1 Tax=Bauhinia variegata TaxID=167791 RepID=A0ACB9LR69_BAUVA|nr:hypothetical protein L6164_026511 [Bauhinia variegata]
MTYIVYMGNLNIDEDSALSHYESMLEVVYGKTPSEASDGPSSQQCNVPNPLNEEFCYAYSCQSSDPAATVNPFPISICSSRPPARETPSKASVGPSSQQCNVPNPPNERFCSIGIVPPSPIPVCHPLPSFHQTPAATTPPARREILHHYKRSFNGFVVELTEEEAARMAEMDGVVSVLPNEMNQPHTTRSWDSIDFPKETKRNENESNIIIGVIDGGIWPESPSFDDKGLDHPRIWNGSCNSSNNFTCNNKIIGAKYYKTNKKFSPNDFISPRDSKGHGTHVASIAAGIPVRNASMLGFGLGTAGGAVPSARIAVYKVCWDDCRNSDIFAAFDDAIADGVDILSVSVGCDNCPQREYFNNKIAIGAFHALSKGILTVTSAGNEGPPYKTLSNFSPWTISVGASTMDRKFVTKVKLGNNKTYEGISINTFDLKGDMYPLIYGGDAPNITGGNETSSSRFCEPYSLDPVLVQGKIVLCDHKNRTIVVGAFLAGAAGVLIRGEENRDFGQVFPLPASYLTWHDGDHVLSYLNSTRNATATIYRSEEVKDTSAPAVFSFSSRGPNLVTPDILKPDLVAPGVHILAGWSESAPVSNIAGDERKLPFNIYSGTSMACPHVSGAAAYIKSFHPTWSPAAIRSALMTTAKPLINQGTEFEYGAGLIDPIKAVNPGLVYDAGETDYIKFLCGQNITEKHLRSITGDNTSSCNHTTRIEARDLNYPSFALRIRSTNSINATFSRTVTNVGSPKSTYKATVTAPERLSIQVNPSVLPFTDVGQNLTFVLSIVGAIEKPVVSASLVWNDGKFKVRSPIVVYSM